MTITQEQLDSTIPENLKNIVSVESSTLRDEAIEIIDCLHESLQLISDKVRNPFKTKIFLTGSPFTINMSNGVLKVSPNDEVINLCIENIILIDVNKIYSLGKNLITATILEELVHVLFNVKDENLTSIIVASLYDGIDLNESGQYMVPKDL